MIKADLHSGWTVRAAAGTTPPVIGDDPLPATVPGTIHTDLLDAGLIPDPYLGVNEESLAWLHRSGWLYETTVPQVEAAADERVDLVFDGLDTVATVTLGGAGLGRTVNMHRSYRFDVRSLLAAGPAPLSVRFDSALEYAEEIEKLVGPRPSPYPHPFNAVRKMACSFGWDWGPDLQTAGIWKPVRLERWRVARLAEVRPLATLDSDGRTGRLQVHVVLEHSGLSEGTALAVRVKAAGEIASLDPSLGFVDLEIPDAPVWWPVGQGSQPLVPVTVELLDGDEVLDSVTRRVGFRSVVVDQTDGAFTLVVNGRAIFALGLNWIPEDHLLTRLTRERYAAAIDRAVAANANLLRVWGGGIYESDDFYDLCDERGVLVWQDFPFACAAYSEEEPLRSEIEAETRENVARICSHPSLAVYCGGNENIWGHEDWGWKEELGDLTWGAGYYYDVFPSLLAELDPTRPYHPGSPSSPGHDPDDVHPNDDRFGTRHEWEAWNREDYTWHEKFTPRFCTEFGWQAPPAWATLTETLEPAELSKTSPGFLLHQKAAGGNEKLDRGLARHMGVPEEFGLWHWATQLNQARATKYAVEHLRSWAPHTMGSVIWQLNDCWPVTSWAVVDGAGRLKPAWYALRSAYAPRLITFQRRGESTALVVVNSSGETWSATAAIGLVTFEGDGLAAHTESFEVPPRSVVTVPLDFALLYPDDPARTVLVAEVDGLRATRFFAEDNDLAYDPAPLDARAFRTDGGYEVTVTATSFARDVALLADRLAPDAVVDEMLVDLLPGESHTFHVRTDAVLDPGAFFAPEVLRTANVLG